MALPASGTISLNQMHTEVGGSSGTLCSINDADIRGLIGKTSAATSSFSQFYGASSRGEQTYTSAGTYTWTAPFSGNVCILCIGAGSDGGSTDCLGWRCWRRWRRPQRGLLDILLLQ